MPITYDVIYSERIWEYDVDRVRLSSMTNARFITYLRETFHFANADLTQPYFLDGTSADTWPPGIVCELGVAPVNLDVEREIAEEVAFKSLKISSNRIGIEVAGRTDYADQVFRFFTDLLAESETPEGQPFIGQYRELRDVSLIAIRGAERPQGKLIPHDIEASFREAFSIDVDHIPYYEIAMNFSAPSDKAADNGQAKWMLRPRFDTSVGEGVLESRAWLDSDAHTSLLQSVFEG